MAHAFRSLGAPEPVALFASGTAAPTLRLDYDRGFADPKTDAELIEQLRSLNGTSEEVLANQELMSLTLPILRADFQLCGRFRASAATVAQMPGACARRQGGSGDHRAIDRLVS
jgi:surfactin synthase thioesterase subunit